MKVSIIVSTYNRVEALASVLLALSQQEGVDPHQWEIVVADDGSRPETAELIAELAAKIKCKIVHVWHPDEGFRLAAIRNLSAAVATGEWLVFLDGDCVPFSDFVWRQRSLAEEGWFVAGSRVLLNDALTREICDRKEAAVNLPRLKWWQWMQICAARKCNVWMPKLRLPLGGLRKIRRRSWQILKGCNIGVWKSDYLAVNGFDESFSGWGREDSDFAIRLIRKGIGLKDGRFAVPVLHLWHRENDRSNLAENERRLAEILASDRIRAVAGVDTYDAARGRAAVRQSFG